MKGISTKGKCTQGIMSNQGFGLLVISRSIEGILVTIHIPENWVTNEGKIKKYALLKVRSMFLKAHALIIGGNFDEM